MLLGLVAASSLSDGPPAKGLAVVALGVAFGCIGTDIYSGAERFTFDTLNLTDGLNLIALAIGLFGNRRDHLLRRPEGADDGRQRSRCACAR